MATKMQIQETKAYVNSDALRIGDEFIVQKMSLMPHKLPEYTRVTVTAISETRLDMNDGSSWYRRSVHQVGDILGLSTLLLATPETIKLSENVTRFSSAQTKFIDAFKLGFDARRAEALAAAAEAYDAAMQSMDNPPDQEHQQNVAAELLDLALARTGAEKMEASAPEPASGSKKNESS